MGSVTNHLFFVVLLFGALHARAVLSTAGEADFTPELDRVASAAPATGDPMDAAIPRAPKDTAALDSSALEHAVFTHINLYLAAKGMRPL